MNKRNLGATVAQILVNLNEGHAVEPGSSLHAALARTFDDSAFEINAELLATLKDASPYVQHTPFCAVTLARATGRDDPACDCGCNETRAAIAKAEAE